MASNKKQHILGNIQLAAIRKILKLSISTPKIAFYDKAGQILISYSKNNNYCI